MFTPGTAGKPHGYVFEVPSDGQGNPEPIRDKWVPILTPDDPSPTMPGNFVWAQGWAQGAATFGRLEGCWYGNQKIYIVSTNGGGATAAASSGQGQVWSTTGGRKQSRCCFSRPVRRCSTRRGTSP